MKSHITMMIGDKPSIKKYHIDRETDTVKKGSVSVSFLHDSQVIAVENINDLYNVIGYVREVENSYIIRGRSEADFQSGTRRTLFHDDDHLHPNFEEVGTAWVCCDFDQYEVPNNIDRTSIEAIEHLILYNLPKQFQNVSYIYQWSASAGLEYKSVPVKSGTSVHLFFYLDKLVNTEQLKFWFRKQIADGFDRSTFNVVTPVFVGSKVEKDNGIIDVIAEERKYGLVTKKANYATVPVGVINPPVQLPNVKKKGGGGISIDVAGGGEILSKLNEVGAIYKKGTGYIKLWHPAEGSRGDWFVYTKSLGVVHHHVKKSMGISNWLKTFWNVDYQPPGGGDDNIELLAQLVSTIRNKNKL